MWSDGQPVTAHDFVYSWNRAINPETAADYEYMFESIAGYADGNLDVVALDDRTLQVRLVAVTPYFLELTAFPAYFPVRQDIVEADPDGWATRVATYISNGPFRLVEWVDNSHMLYEQNEYYWNRAALGPDRLRFVLMDDDNALLAAYNSGELSYISKVPNEEIPALIDRSDFHLIGQLGTYYASFNTQVPPLDNPRFRQALVLAIDREFITKQIGQTGQINAGAFVPEGMNDATPGSSFREIGGNYYDPSPEGFAANLEKAKAIIAELYPDGNIPTLEYTYNIGTGHQLIGEALQNMWAEIGVNVTLQSLDWAVFQDNRKNGNYQIARNGWINDYNDPIGMLDMFITGGGNNNEQWSNPDFDALIAQIKSSSDADERMKLMHQAEDILFDEWIFAPIYYYVDHFMINDDIQGFYGLPLGNKFFMYATR